MICDYGCKQEAKYQFKNGKWCCSKNHSMCLSMRNKKSILTKGRVGKCHTKETKKKISEANKGKIYHKKSYKKLLTITQIKEKYPIFFKVEKIRYNPKKLNEIQVQCKNHKCKNSREQHGWFTPTRYNLFMRIYAIEKIYGSGESNFYCCEECKQTCPLFNFHYYDTKISSLYTPEEYQIWRKTVLVREEYICEYCDKLATDVHHSRPQKLEPGFVLDPDFGVSCCEKCHYKYGHKTGTECSTGNLSITYCNN